MKSLARASLIAALLLGACGRTSRTDGEEAHCGGCIPPSECLDGICVPATHAGGVCAPGAECPDDPCAPATNADAGATSERAEGERCTQAEDCLSGFCAGI